MGKKMCMVQLLPWKTENIEWEMRLILQKAFKDNILPHKIISEKLFN